MFWNAILTDPAEPPVLEAFAISSKLLVETVAVQLPPDPGTVGVPERLAPVVVSPVGVFVEGGEQPESEEQRSMAIDLTVVELTVLKVKVYVAPVALGVEVDMANLRLVI